MDDRDDIRSDDVRMYPPYVICTLIPPDDPTGDPSPSYRCNFCHYATDCKSDISRHSSQHVFRCSQCDYTTYMQHRLLEHKEQRHNRSHPVPYHLLSLSATAATSKRLRVFSPPPPHFSSYKFPLQIRDKFKQYTSSDVLDSVHTAEVSQSESGAALITAVTADPIVPLNEAVKLCAVPGSKPIKSLTEAPLSKSPTLLPTSSQTEVNTLIQTMNCKSTPIVRSKSESSPPPTIIKSSLVKVGKESAHLLTQTPSRVKLSTDYRRPSPQTESLHHNTVLNHEGGSERHESEASQYESEAVQYESEAELLDSKVTVTPTCSGPVDVNMLEHKAQSVACNALELSTYLSANTNLTTKESSSKYSPVQSPGAHLPTKHSSTAPQSASHTPVNNEKQTDDKTVNVKDSMGWSNLNYVELLVVHNRLHKLKKWIASQKPSRHIKYVIPRLYKIPTEASCVSIESVYEYVSPFSDVVSKEANSMTSSRLRRPSGQKIKVTLSRAKTKRPPEVRRAVKLGAEMSEEGVRAAESVIQDDESYSSDDSESECSIVSHESLSSTGMENVTTARAHRTSKGRRSNSDRVVTVKSRASRKGKEDELRDLTITTSTTGIDLLCHDGGVSLPTTSYQRRRRGSSRSTTSSAASITGRSTGSAAAHVLYTDNIPVDSLTPHRPTSAASSYDYHEEEPLTSLSRPGSRASSYKDLIEASPSLSVTSESNTLKKVTLKKQRSSNTQHVSSLGSSLGSQRGSQRRPCKSVEDIFGSPPTEEVSRTRNTLIQCAEFLDPEDSEEKRLAAIELYRKKKEEEEAESRKVKKDHQGRDDMPFIEESSTQAAAKLAPLILPSKNKKLLKNSSLTDILPSTKGDRHRMRNCQARHSKDVPTLVQIVGEGGEQAQMCSMKFRCSQQVMTIRERGKFTLADVRHIDIEKQIDTERSLDEKNYMEYETSSANPPSSMYASSTSSTPRLQYRYDVDTALLHKAEPNMTTVPYLADQSIKGDDTVDDTLSDGQISDMISPPALPISIALPLHTNKVNTPSSATLSTHQPSTTNTPTLDQQLIKYTLATTAATGAVSLPESRAGVGDDDEIPRLDMSISDSPPAIFTVKKPLVGYGGAMSARTLCKSEKMEFSESVSSAAEAAAAEAAAVSSTQHDLIKPSTTDTQSESNKTRWKRRSTHSRVTRSKSHPELKSPDNPTAATTTAATTTATTLVSTLSAAALPNQTNTVTNRKRRLLTRPAPPPISPERKQIRLSEGQSLPDTVSEVKLESPSAPATTFSTASPTAPSTAPPTAPPTASQISVRSAKSHLGGRHSSPAVPTSSITTVITTKNSDHTYHCSQYKSETHRRSSQTSSQGGSQNSSQGVIQNSSQNEATNQLQEQTDLQSTKIRLSKRQSLRHATAVSLYESQTQGTQPEKTASAKRSTRALSQPMSNLTSLESKSSKPYNSSANTNRPGSETTTTSHVSKTSSSSCTTIQRRRLSRPPPPSHTDSIRRQPARGESVLLRRAFGALKSKSSQILSITKQSDGSQQKLDSLFGDKISQEFLHSLPTRVCTPSPPRKDNYSTQLNTQQLHQAETAFTDIIKQYSVTMVEVVRRHLPHLYHSAPPSAADRAAGQICRLDSVYQANHQVQSQCQSPPYLASPPQTFSPLRSEQIPEYDAPAAAEEPEGLRCAMITSELSPCGIAGYVPAVTAVETVQSREIIDGVLESAHITERIPAMLSDIRSQYVSIGETGERVDTVHTRVVTDTKYLIPLHVSCGEHNLLVYNNTSLIDTVKINTGVKQSLVTDTAAVASCQYAELVEPPLIIHNIPDTHPLSPVSSKSHTSTVLPKPDTISPQLSVDGSESSAAFSCSTIDENFYSAGESLTEHSPESPAQLPKLPYTSVMDATDSDTPLCDDLTAAAPYRVEPVIVDIHSEFCSVAESRAERTKPVTLQTIAAADVGVHTLSAHQTNHVKISEERKSASDLRPSTPPAGTSSARSLENKLISSSFKSKLQLAYQKGALIKKAQQEASRNGGHKSCISPSIPSCTVSDVSSAHVSLLPESPTVIKETINLVTPTTVSTEDGQTTRPHKRPHHKEKSKSTSGDGSSKSKKSKKEKKHKKYKSKQKEVSPSLLPLTHDKNKLQSPKIISYSSPLKKDNPTATSGHGSSSASKRKRSLVSLEDSLIFYDVPGTERSKKEEEKQPVVNNNLSKIDTSSGSVHRPATEHSKVNGNIAKSIEKKRKSSSQHSDNYEKKSKTIKTSSTKTSKSKTKSITRRKNSSGDKSRTPTPVVDLISPSGDTDEHKLPWSNKTIEDVCRCDLCDFISIEMDDLIEHKKEVHAVRKLTPRLAACEYDPVFNPDVEYKCTLCGLSDNKLRVIRRHISDAHQAKLRTCERVTHTRGVEGFSLCVETVQVYRDSQAS